MVIREKTKSVKLVCTQKSPSFSPRADEQEMLIALCKQKQPSAQGTLLKTRYGLREFSVPTALLQTLNKPATAIVVPKISQQRTIVHRQRYKESRTRDLLTELTQTGTLLTGSTV
jgi:hypothetical protein